MQNGSTGQAENPEFHDRVKTMVEGWKRKLLDLTRRNRALNFKPTKVSTVAVVDEHPVEIFRRIYLQELPMKFRAQESQRASAGGSDASNDSSVNVPVTDEETDVDEIDGLGIDFTPYDATSLAERYTDEWLQTNSTPEALDKSLRRIDELARTAIEEQGVRGRTKGSGL